MKKITTLLSDVGGVMLTNGWGHESRQLAAERFGVDYPAMQARHELTFATYELGRMSLDEYLDYTVFYTDRPFSRHEWTEFMYAQSQPLPGVMDLISNLKHRHGLRVGVVNNEGRELNAYRIQTYQLTRFVDFFISSGSVGMSKPDANIFRLALDAAQADPDEVVYLEDRQLFVDVACKLGIHGIHHVDLATTVHALRKFGLDV